MVVQTVQDRLRILFHVWRERGFKDDAEVCDLAADAMDDQAATIARLTAENERLIRLVERAYREGYNSGFHEGGGGFNGYLAMDTQPDPDTAWDYSEAAEHARDGGEGEK